MKKTFVFAMVNPMWFAKLFIISCVFFPLSAFIYIAHDNFSFIFHYWFPLVGVIACGLWACRLSSLGRL